MTKRSRNFKAKMRACRGVARTGGVVAAASLAFVSRGYGEALRFQLNDHIPPGTPEKGYDLNGDGEMDVFFDTSPQLGVLMEQQRYGYGGGSYTFGFILGQSGEVPYGFEAGVALPGVPGDGSREQGMLNSGDGGAFYGHPSPRYAGLYFFSIQAPDTLLHAAWMELKVTGSMATGYGLDVIAYGYETDHEVGIVTGEPQTPVPVERTTWGQIKSLYAE